MLRLAHERIHALELIGRYHKCTTASREAFKVPVLTLSHLKEEGLKG
ncbi:MAG: hypothetical protein ABEJ64_04265 [Candidatus Nanohaloarchaea archaeon]